MIYDASKTTGKESTWKTILTAPRDDDSEYERLSITARADDAYKNNPLAKSAIERVVDFTIGCGMRLYVNLDHEALGISKEEAQVYGRQYEREFDLWASSKNSDAQRTLPFYAMQALVMTTADLRGDCFVDTPMIPSRGRYELSLNLIEGDRVSNPYLALDRDKLTNGIELDKWGAPCRYHIRKAHPADVESQNKAYEWDSFPRYVNGFERVLHVFRKRRGYRGVSILSTALKTLRKISQLDEAELDAAVLNALFAVISQTPTGEGIGFPQQRYGVTETETGAIPLNKEEKKNSVLDTGLIVNKMEGDKIEFVDPKRPNINVMNYTAELYKRLASGMGIPVEELMLNYNKSYSASRAAMLRAWEKYKILRYWIEYSLCDPIYKLWFHEAYVKGYIQAPGYEDPRFRDYWNQSDWIGVGKGSIDELKEAQAATERIANGTSNIQIESREQKGRDYFREVHSQRVLETTKRKEDGLEGGGGKNGIVADDVS